MTPTIDHRSWTELDGQDISLKVGEQFYDHLIHSLINKK